MNHDQFTLPFLDTTTVGGSFGLYGSFPPAKSPVHAHKDFKPDEVEIPDAPVHTKPSVPAQDYRLAGDRRLAESWKGRAEDNLAAIRLMTAIETEGRHAGPDEQERLAKFTSFGATDLAEKLFRRAGEGFAPAWEDLGLELEELVSREDLASLTIRTPAFGTRISQRRGCRSSMISRSAIRRSPTAPSAPTIRLASCACPCTTILSPARPSGCPSGITDRYSSAPYEGINARHVILTATRVRVCPS